jgi:hypothetical protein
MKINGERRPWRKEGRKQRENGETATEKDR